MIIKGFHEIYFVCIGLENIMIHELFNIGQPMNRPC